MTPSARSVFAFGVYLAALGSTLILIPNQFLALFAMPPVHDVWIRAMGMCLLFFSTYHILAARSEFVPFFKWSVYVRATVIVFFTAFVVAGWAPPSLILFGVIDLAGALWTRRTLRVWAPAIVPTSRSV
jgi:hypothetical protein